MKKYEPNYMKTYSKHLTKIFDMPRSRQRVLGYILDRMNDRNEISLSGGARVMAKEKLGMAENTLAGSLYDLTQSGILAMPEKAFYVANPYIFTKKKKWGDVLNQRKNFRAIIDYGIDDSFTIRGEWH